MKILTENEMYDAFVNASYNDTLDKFSVVRFRSGNSVTHAFTCKIITFGQDKALIESPCFSGAVTFNKSSLDNRFYCFTDSFTYALCLDAKEASSISEIHSEANEFLSDLTEKMKLLTSEELQPIAMYIEGCFERRYNE